MIAAAHDLGIAARVLAYKRNCESVVGGEREVGFVVRHDACRDGAEVLEDVANVERFGQRWKKRVKGIELVEVGWGSAIVVILFSLDGVRVKSDPAACGRP